MATARFEALVNNPYVDVPKAVTEKLGGPRARRVHVRVRRKGTRAPPAMPDEAARLQRVGRLTSDGGFRTNIVGVRGELDRLYLHGWMSKHAGADVRDRVVVTLRPDPEARKLPLPKALQRALKADPARKAAWDALTPSRRNEALSYLNYLKSDEAVERNVAKLWKQIAVDSTRPLNGPSF